jgi:hypothetical protein
MRSVKAFPHYVLAGALLCSTALLCSPALKAQSFAPSIRIVDRIDESNLVTLKGNTHPAATAKNDRGRVSPSLPMTDLILVLSRSTEQQAAFEKFVASQYDSSSTNFHQWLTPEQIGQNFGPSETDIATISNWLIQHGFSVDEVTKDRMSIRFSGTAAQVESAFHTEIHNLEVKGVAHIGNMSDPQIPAALAPAVVGIKALHNFFPRPLHRMGSAVQRDSKTGKWMRAASLPAAASATRAASSARVRPLFGISVPATSTTIPYLVEDVAPYDFATIYNVLPLWNASTAIDGTGETIAIAGTSSIKTSDVATFRTTFGLPTTNAANTPILQSGNSEPLTVCTSTVSTALCGIDDEIENALDVEWSGSIAKNAQIVLVSSYPASASDDNLYDSESYIIENVSNSASPVHNAHVMNVSYGECELGMGTGGNVEYYNLWQTAAAEGIAVFVAAGDSGAASCDDGGDETYGVPYAAEYGVSVSGLASTPYNTAVGGTDFNWCSLGTIWNGSECTASPYWKSSNSSTTGASALGYVPEVPWNDTCTSPLALTYMNDFFSYYFGQSASTAETACNTIVNDYYYLDNNTYGFMLDFVDTVGGGGGASNCVVNSTNTSGTTLGACTTGSASTGATTNPDTGAAQTSIVLYNDGWPKPTWQTGVAGIPNDGVRDLPDVSFFASDGFLSNSAYLICVSDVTPCTYSAQVEPTELEVGGTSVATPAMAGVMALINQKAGSWQGFPNQQLYELAAKQSYSNCSSEKATTSNGCYFNDIDTGTIAMACDDGEFNSTGVASPNCVVTYPADEGGVGILSGYSAGTGYDQATGLGSLNVANVVNNWPASIGNKAATVTVSPASGSITADQILVVTVTLASTAAGGTTPTGTVTLSGGGYTSAAEALSSGSYQFTIPADSLSAGTDTLTASYSGDSTYAQASGTASVTVTKLTPSVSVLPSASSIDSNQLLTVTGTVTGADATPTGTVTLSGDGYTSSAVKLDSSGNYSFTIPYNALDGASGTYPLVVFYSGDATYNSTSGSANVTVTYIAVLTPNVAVTPATSSVDSGQSLSVKVAVTGSGATPTGTISLSGGGYSLTTQTIGVGSCTNSNCTFTIPANTLSAGPQTLVANYSGDPNYASGNSTAPLSVTPSVFSVVATTPADVSSPGGSTTSTVTVNTSTYYAGTVTLSCALTNYPAGASYLPSCSLSPTTATLNSTTTSGTATATITTTAATSELAYPKLPGRSRGIFGAAGGALLAFVVFLGIPARRRSWRSMLGVLVLMALLGSLTACGGGSSSNNNNTGTTGTTTGTYTFTVTATGNDVNTTKETTTFTVTVD